MTTSPDPREELAQFAYLSGYKNPDSEFIQPLAERPKWEKDCHYRAADEILAAGYRKPRTITTVEELDELPVGSILRLTGDDMPDDAAIKVRYEIHDESFEHSWEVSGSTENFTNAQMLDDEPDTVITVMWEPEA